jgi:hypothetical protein
MEPETARLFRFDSRRRETPDSPTGTAWRGRAGRKLRTNLTRLLRIRQ